MFIVRFFVLEFCNQYSKDLENKNIECWNPRCVSRCCCARWPFMVNRHSADVRQLIDSIFLEFSATTEKESYMINPIFLFRWWSTSAASHVIQQLHESAAILWSAAQFKCIVTHAIRLSTASESSSGVRAYLYQWGFHSVATQFSQQCMQLSSEWCTMSTATKHGLHLRNACQFPNSSAIEFAIPSFHHRSRWRSTFSAFLLPDTCNSYRLSRQCHWILRDGHISMDVSDNHDK